jgi:hypothetical protein
MELHLTASADAAMAFFTSGATFVARSSMDRMILACAMGPTLI